MFDKLFDAMAVGVVLAVVVVLFSSGMVVGWAAARYTAPAAQPTTTTSAALPAAQRAWCPAMLDGRPLMRSVLRENDAEEPVLACFYASAPVVSDGRVP